VSLTLRTTSAQQTIALGERLARHLRAGNVVLLHGDLGSGKTTLAQGVLAGLGVAGPVPSPTFTLVNEYDGMTAIGGPVRVYHLDLYRLASEADLDSIGLDDYLAPTDGITLIEWPERAESHFEGDYLLVEIRSTGEAQRQIRLSSVPSDSDRFAWLSGQRLASDGEEAASIQPAS
jgi:tRNA threonylcarbamoyladenosine biosynthesis protein TsaE